MKLLMGSNINEKTIPVVKRAVSIGCGIGNHSYSHPFMDKLSVDEIKEEISRTEELIRGITGEGSVFFRPPFFATSDIMFDTIDMCFITGLGCRDWEKEVTDKERVRMVMDNACDGAIILLHDQPDNYPTVRALEELLPLLAEQGYSFVSVPELFRRKGVDPKAASSRNRVFSVVEG